MSQQQERSFVDTRTRQERGQQAGGQASAPAPPEGGRGLTSFVPPEREEQEAVAAPQLEPLEKQIMVAVTDPRSGQRRTATITSRVPRGDEAARLPACIVSLSGGVNINLLPVEVQELILARAFIVLQARDIPVWLDQMLMTDAYAEVAFKLAEALAAHRNRFFWPDAGQGQGAAQGHGLNVEVGQASAAGA